MRNRLLVLMTLSALCLAAIPAYAQGGGKHRFFDRMDTNKDGFLTLAEIQKEFPKFTPEFFKQADTNGDGKLSVAEWQGFVKARHGGGKASGPM